MSEQRPDHAELMAELRGLREVMDVRMKGVERELKAVYEIGTKRLDDHSKRIRQIEKDHGVHKWTLRGLAGSVAGLLGLHGFHFF